MLNGFDRLDAQALLRGNEIGQRAVFVLARDRREHACESVESQDASANARFEVARLRNDRGARVFGGRHLTRHELTPDHLVQTYGIAFHSNEHRRRGADVRRTNRFVRFLCSSLARVRVRLFGQILRAEFLADVFAHRRHRVARQVRRVGTHIGDVAGFVKSLGHHHRLLHAERHARAGRLLQRRRDERRVRPRSGRAVFARSDGKWLASQASHRIVGLLRTRRAIVLASIFEYLESITLIVVRALQVREGFPVFLRNERANFALAFHDQPHRYRLDAAGRETPRDLRPQQRRQFEADHAVEEPPRLLRADATSVDGRRIRERFLNRFARDFVENDAPITIRVAADGFLQVPGDGLAFAIEVGREIDLIRLLCEFAQFVDHLLLAGQDFVGGLPVVFRVHTHAPHELRTRALLAVSLFCLRRKLAGFRGFFCARLRITGFAAGRQIADVTDAGLYDVVLAEIPIDGPRLGRRLDDDQRTGHVPPAATGGPGAKGAMYTRSISGLST